MRRCGAKIRPPEQGRSPVRRWNPSTTLRRCNPSRQRRKSAIPMLLQVSNASKFTIVPKSHDCTIGTKCKRLSSREERGRKKFLTKNYGKNGKNFWGKSLAAFSLPKNGCSAPFKNPFKFRPKQP